MERESDAATTVKKVLAGLLAVCCLAAVTLLVTTPKPELYHLSNLNQADSLILSELQAHRIAQRQVRRIDYPVNEQFTRARYVIDMPPGSSPTHLHGDLSRRLRPWGISVRGRVDVPGGVTTLDLLYRTKVVRTLELRRVTAEVYSNSSD